MERIWNVLQTLRVTPAQDEYTLHTAIARCLMDAGMVFRHEAILGNGCRADFFCEGIVIEVKRGRPNAKELAKQCRRYLLFSSVRGLIVVVERSVFLPDQMEGKPLRILSLNALWGISHQFAEDPFCTQEVVEEDSIPSGALSSPEATEETMQWDENEADDEPRFLETGPEDVPNPYPKTEETPESSVLFSVLNEGVPPFLQLQKEQRYTYGTLSYNARRKQWVIKGEPAVTEMAKRLFPGSSGSKRGEARFTAHSRIIGDLNWLMIRFPLAIHPRDEARYRTALTEAGNYYRARERARTTPLTFTPDKASFTGELRPFQQTGTAFLNLTPRCLLADEMGLGKTVQALCSVSARKLFPCCVVVPPHLIINWQREIERFVRIDGRIPRVHVLRGLTPYALPEADFYLVHYLLLRGWKESLPECSFRAVIFDEIQELRRGGTDKYSAASLLAESSENVIGLSGTPIYNYGGEVWNVINILDYHFLGDWESFTREWCAGYGNRLVLKPQLLGEYLRHEGMMLRRTKEEVLPELPEKRRLVQEIDADDLIYQQLMEPVKDKLRSWFSETDMPLSRRALLEDQISQEERRATGLAKAPFVCQFVRALCESGEKVLLFAHHHAVMDIYKEHLKSLSPVFITGRETEKEKQRAVDRFMEGTTGLCCISLRSGSGLNLQKATCVVFGELDWSPAVHSQAEDRAHRLGQKDSLLCYYLVSPKGSDADMQEALGLKVSQFAGLMGQKPVRAEDAQQNATLARKHVERLLKTMQEKGEL